MEGKVHRQLPTRMKHVPSILCLTILLAGFVQAHTHRRERTGPFVATAFAQRGITRSGLRAQSGVVAADTRVLPLGTKIRVRNAGPYSGTYTVADTGSRVRGHRIDIFMPSRRQAMKFGRQIVEVKVLRWGEG
jgi:3D (Asp-Asp-Asp) domain-containing protein